MSGMPHSPYAGMGTHAQAMAKNCPDAKLAMAFQYVAIGSMVIMGAAGIAHLIKDIGGTWSKERATHGHHELHGRANGHYRGR